MCITCFILLFPHFHFICFFVQGVHFTFFSLLIKNFYCLFPSINCYISFPCLVIKHSVSNISQCKMLKFPSISLNTNKIDLSNILISSTFIFSLLILPLLFCSLDITVIILFLSLSSLTLNILLLW